MYEKVVHRSCVRIQFPAGAERVRGHPVQALRPLRGRPCNRKKPVSATPAIRAFGTTATPDTTATRSMAVAESRHRSAIWAKRRHTATLLASRSDS